MCALVYELNSRPATMNSASSAVYVSLNPTFLKLNSLLHDTKTDLPYSADLIWS